MLIADVEDNFQVKLRQPLAANLYQIHYGKAVVTGSYSGHRLGANPCLYGIRGWQVVDNLKRQVVLLVRGSWRVKLDKLLTAGKAGFVGSGRTRP